MAMFLLKKSYRLKDLEEIPFNDLWGSKGVFTTMRMVGNTNKIKKAINACKKYNAVILDKTKKSNVIQITALRREIDKMAKNLKKFGLVSISRTGAVAMTRGDKVFN